MSPRRTLQPFPHEVQCSKSLPLQTDRETDSGEQPWPEGSLVAQRVLGDEVHKARAAGQSCELRTPIPTMLSAQEAIPTGVDASPTPSVVAVVLRIRVAGLFPPTAALGLSPRVFPTNSFSGAGAF